MPSRTSLTSRVSRLTTGPVPSVGSDDCPSRYIWRWIWRRSVVATSQAASARIERRYCATRQSGYQEQTRGERQHGRQRADVVPERRHAAQKPQYRPWRPARWSGFELVRLAATIGNSPVSAKSVYSWSTPGGLMTRPIWEALSPAHAMDIAASPLRTDERRVSKPPTHKSSQDQQGMERPPAPGSSARA